MQRNAGEVLPEPQPAEARAHGQSARATRGTLPREIVYVYLAAPLVSQPIANPSFFETPARELWLEIAGNYVPALAILLGLWGVYRWSMPRLTSRVMNMSWRLVLQTALCALAAAAMSVAVYPLHRLYIDAPDLLLSVYLQRNVGVTCLVVVPALLLRAERERALGAERRLLEREKQALWAQIQALQSRTHPHFLFNVLNTIMALIRDDAELAERSVQRLSNILRYALESSRVSQVPLERELTSLEEYLELQKARFGERLRYELAVDPALANAPVLPFVLQPLVENALLHAVARRAEGGWVRVTVAREAASVSLRVDDDGPGPGASNHRGSGTSLSDLAQRLLLVHGDRAWLRTGGNSRGGFSAELRLPLDGGLA